MVVGVGDRRCPPVSAQTSMTYNRSLCGGSYCLGLSVIVLIDPYCVVPLLVLFGIDSNSIWIFGDS